MDVLDARDCGRRRLLGGGGGGGLFGSVDNLGGWLADIVRWR